MKGKEPNTRTKKQIKNFFLSPLWAGGIAVGFSSPFRGAGGKKTVPGGAGTANSLD